MSEQELQEIEGILEMQEPAPTVDIGAQDIRALIAEVRRLQGAIDCMVSASPCSSPR